VNIGSRSPWAYGAIGVTLLLLGTTIAGTLPSNAQPDLLDRDLSGYWRFDEGRGRIAQDETPFANDGQLVGTDSPDWVLGLVEFALDFYGRRGASVQVPDAPSLDAQEALTLACWVCLRRQLALESEDDTFTLFAKPFDEAYQLSIAREEGPLIGSIRLRDGRVVRIKGERPVPYDRWVHVAFTYDATTGEARLYLDGELDAVERIGPGLIAVNEAPLLLGAALDPTVRSGEEPFRVLPGILDEARLYRRVLHPEEILRLAQEAALSPQPVCGKCYAPPAVNVLLNRLIEEPLITQEMFFRWMLLLLNPSETIPMNAPFEEMVQLFRAMGILPEGFPLDPQAPITFGEAALLLLRALEIETPLLDQLLLSAGLQAAGEAALEIAVREGLMPPADPDDILTGAALSLMSDRLLLRLETAPPSYYSAKDVECAQVKRLLRAPGPQPPPPPGGDEPPSS